MEKINKEITDAILEKAREHLAALNEELGVKTFNEDVISRLGDYVDEYIHRQLEDIDLHNHLSDLQFSINHNNQVELDDFYVDSDEIARELNACEALEYAIDKYENEIKIKNELVETRNLNPTSPTPPVSVAEQLNSNNTKQNEG